MKLYMLYNAEIKQDQISNLEWEYEASSNMMNLCLGNITGVLVISDTINFPEEKSSYARGAICYIAPKYSKDLELQDEWLHFVLQEPLNRQFVQAPSAQVCLCTIKEFELTDKSVHDLETAFPSKIAILDAASPQTKLILEENGWAIAQAYS